MTKIYLVEDHHIVRYGVKSLFETHTQYSVVGEADNPETLLSQLPFIKVDVIITDITMDGMNGIELIRKVRQASNDVKILVLSMHADEIYINQSFEAGANGYLLKDFKKTELFSAIERIMKGEIYTSRSVTQILANNYLNKEFSGKTGIGFKVDITKREKEIIELISLGYSNKEIAQKLLISISTVDVHRYNVLKKLEVKNTAEMIMKAIKMKIINLKH